MELFGDTLINEGVITSSQLQTALDYQRKNGGLIGMVLLELGYITTEQLTTALCKQVDKNIRYGK